VRTLFEQNPRPNFSSQPENSENPPAVVENPRCKNRHSSVEQWFPNITLRYRLQYSEVPRLFCDFQNAYRTGYCTSERNCCVFAIGCHEISTFFCIVPWVWKGWGPLRSTALPDAVESRRQL